MPNMIFRLKYSDLALTQFLFFPAVSSFSTIYICAWCPCVHLVMWWVNT